MRINQEVLDQSTNCPLHGSVLMGGAYGNYCVDCWNEMYPKIVIEPQTLKHIEQIQTQHAKQSEQIELARQIAAQREKIHQHHKSSRPLSDNYQYIGIRGEMEFARVFDVPFDAELRPTGDKGIDFVVADNTIDVKTRNDARELLVEVNKVKAKIYVLAAYHKKTDSCQLIGWEFGQTISKAPTKTVKLFNHYIPHTQLKSIEELKAFLITCGWCPK